VGLAPGNSLLPQPRGKNKNRDWGPGVPSAEGQVANVGTASVRVRGEARNKDRTLEPANNGKETQENRRESKHGEAKKIPITLGLRARRNNRMGSSIKTSTTRVRRLGGVPELTENKK